MGFNTIKAYRRDIVECLGETSRCYVIRRSGFELEGQVVEGGALETDRLYHLAAAHVWRDAVEPIFLAIKHADTRRAVNLVAAEGEEVAVEFLNVDGHVGCALGSVDENGNAVLMGYAYDVADRIDRTQDVADVRDANDFRPLAEELFVLVHTEPTVVGDRHHTQADALSCLKKLPRDDVAVVLHLAEDDLVALLHKSLSEAGCHEVDALGSAAREDNLTGAAGIQETAYRFARCLVQICCLLRKEMHAAMHVGIDVVVFLRHRLHDLSRLLRRRCIIEIDKGVLAVEDLVQDREQALPQPLPCRAGRSYYC